MHDLESWITEWRKTLMAARHVGRDAADELESHLREHVDLLVRSGMTEAEAFQLAVRQLGSPPAIASEFQKLERGTWWPVRAVAGVGVAAALLLAVFLSSRFETGRSSLLLAIHVFTVTLGYLSVFLLGTLGVCFVGQRCVADFTPIRLQSLSRVSFTFGCVATSLTAIGVVLGTVWARLEWGRYWAWDAKETGGLCVVIWLICFLTLHRVRWVTAGSILLLSVLGNIVVSLAWFGGNLLSEVHSYRAPNYAGLLLAVIASNLVVFLVGLAPAGWLRKAGC
ncbi:MAG: hypothetical protein FJ398_05580 [Verrucomicrobia bacterium]|nr:hypothetical protein [Verrucomicrobiota bacterium]